MNERLLNVFVNIVGVGVNKIQEDASVIDDLGCDSIMVVELITALEKEFGVEISDKDADQFSTVGDILEYLHSKGICAKDC